MWSRGAGDVSFTYTYPAHCPGAMSFHSLSVRGDRVSLPKDHCEEQDGTRENSWHE